MIIAVVGVFLIIMAAGAVVIATGARGNDERAQVQSTLASIGKTCPSPKDFKRLNSDEDSFQDRIIAPAQARLLELGKRLTPPERVGRLREKLDIAGNPFGWTVDRAISLKVAFGITGAVIGFLLPALIGAWVPMLVLLPLAALLGFYGPDIAIYQVAHKRTEEVQDGLPDSLDLLTISVESGLAFDAALQQVARNTDGPLAEELSRVLKEMQIGTGRAEALRNLGDRTHVEDLQRFCAAMVQADKLGVPISRVLRVQAAEMRTKRSQRAEEKAQKIPIKILFPLIFCIMPAMFVVIIGPAAIKIFEQMSSGAF